MYNQKDIVKWSQSLTLSGETTLTASPAEAILVDTAGLVEVKYPNGKTDIIQLAAGVWHKILAESIHQNGTTAIGIHVGYLTHSGNR